MPAGTRATAAARRSPSTVTRTGSTAAASTVAFAVAGAGANPAGGRRLHRRGFPTGTVSFAAGETTKTITVNVAGDSTVEPNENFTVDVVQPRAPARPSAPHSRHRHHPQRRQQRRHRLGAPDDHARVPISMPAPSPSRPTSSPIPARRHIRTLSIDLHNSLIAGTVFDPSASFGDTTALDLTPYARAGQRDLGVRPEPRHRRRLQDAHRRLRRRGPCRRARPSPSASTPIPPASKDRHPAPTNPARSRASSMSAPP